MTEPDELYAAEVGSIEHAKLCAESQARLAAYEALRLAHAAWLHSRTPEADSARGGTWSSRELESKLECALADSVCFFGRPHLQLL